MCQLARVKLLFRQLNGTSLRHQNPTQWHLVMMEVNSKATKTMMKLLATKASLKVGKEIVCSQIFCTSAVSYRKACDTAPWALILGFSFDRPLTLGTGRTYWAAQGPKPWHISKFQTLILDSRSDLNLI